MGATFPARLPSLLHLAPPFFPSRLLREPLDTSPFLSGALSTAAAAGDTGFPTPSGAATTTPTPDQSSPPRSRRRDCGRSRGDQHRGDCRHHQMSPPKPGRPQQVPQQRLRTPPASPPHPAPPQQPLPRTSRPHPTGAAATAAAAEEPSTATTTGTTPCPHFSRCRRVLRLSRGEQHRGDCQPGPVAPLQPAPPRLLPQQRLRATPASPPQPMPPPLPRPLTRRPHLEPPRLPPQPSRPAPRRAPRRLLGRPRSGLPFLGSLASSDALEQIL